MCNNVKEPILCSCDSLASVEGVIWQLYKYIGEYPDWMVKLGSVILPTTEEISGLDTTLIKQLLSNNKFDFEYTPSKNDHITFFIKEQVLYKQFEFDGSEWSETCTDTINNLIHDKIKHGTICNK